jgi:hypothetical protein
MVIKEQNIGYNFPSLRYTFVVISVLILILLPQIARGQSSPITASINHEHYSTDELVILTVTVINDDSPQQLRPILPPLDGLAVINFDIATNVRDVSGRIQTETVYTYELQPRRTGPITISSIIVEVDGQIYKALPLSFTVSQGSAPAPSPGNSVAPEKIVPPTGLIGQDFFVESGVNLSNPYIGQQMIYTFRFYQGLKLYRQPQFEMPLFTGLDTIGLPVREYNLKIGGRTYLITEIRTALFPKSDGNIVIGPGLLGFPGNFFEEPAELHTEPVVLQVKSLPDNAPPGFNGAVGQYQIEAWFSPQVAVINQPSTFQVAISGIGNIHTLPEPIWPRLNGWRTYDSTSSLTTDMKEGLMIGTRVYERLIVSDRLGDLIIPPTKLVYFDPIAAEYRTISSKSLSVRVIPAPTPNPATATAVAIGTLPRATPIPPVSTFDPPVSVDNQPVNQLLPDLPRLRLPPVLPFVLLLLWATCAIPVAAVVGAGVFWTWQSRQKGPEIAADVEAETLLQPTQTMHPTLAAALAENNDDNYKAISQALTGYLEHILQTPVKGLTQTELVNRLQERGLAKALVNNIKDYLAQSEMRRYGPGSDDEGWDLLTETDEILFELDEVLEG